MIKCGKRGGNQQADHNRNNTEIGITQPVDGALQNSIANRRSDANRRIPRKRCPDFCTVPDRDLVCPDEQRGEKSCARRNGETCSPKSGAPFRCKQSQIRDDDFPFDGMFDGCAAFCSSIAIAEVND